jgi:hypothetical protein
MTLGELKKQLADTPDELNDCPLVIVVARTTGGEEIAGEVRATRLTHLVPVRSERRRLYVSAIHEGEPSEAVPVLLLETP